MKIKYEGKQYTVVFNRHDTDDLQVYEEGSLEEIEPGDNIDLYYFARGEIYEHLVCEAEARSDALQDR